MSLLFLKRYDVYAVRLNLKIRLFYRYLKKRNKMAMQ